MDDKLELKDGSIWILQDIKNVFQELYDHYRSVVNRNEYLMEENKRLKSETYKDDELAKMKVDYEKMKDDYHRGFPITKEEHEKISQWMKEICEDNADTGAIGGRFIYTFIPTSIGILGSVEDSVTGKRLSFQDLL